MKIRPTWYATHEFACHSADCRPPGSGGTGGSSKGGITTAASFARSAIAAADSAEYGTNAWLNVDGTLTPVAHHSDDGGYDSATIKSRVRVISMPNRKELVVDAQYSGEFSQRQIESIRAVYAQTKAILLTVGGYQRSRGYEVHSRDIEAMLSKFDPRNP